MNLICQLPGCRSQLTRTYAKYCCSAHQRAHYAQQDKAARAAVTRSRIVYCSYCHELIKEPAKNQKIHADCVPLAADERCVQRRARLRSEIPVVEKACVCGRTIRVKATNTKKRYCGNSECYRDRVKAMRLKNHLDGKVIQKRKLPKRIQAEDTLYEDRECICPGCRTLHTVRFEPAYIGREKRPWKFCPRHPGCMRTEEDGYRTLHRESYSDCFECGNSAMV